MKQRRIGEHAVEALPGERELQKILLEDLATRARLRRPDEGRAAVETDRLVTEPTKVRQIATGPAPQIQQHIGRRRLDASEQRGVVLADVMVAGAFPETLGGSLVVAERPRDQALQICGRELASDFVHGRARSAWIKAGTLAQGLASVMLSACGGWQRQRTTTRFCRCASRSTSRIPARIRFRRSMCAGRW